MVATAGTTLTGAVDPIAELADVCATHGVWLHVDGAYGLPAAAAPADRRRFARARPGRLGHARRAQVAVRARRPAACCSCAAARTSRRVLATTRPTSRTSGRPATRSTSRSSTRGPFRALKLWLAFRAHGAQAFRDAIEENLRQARLLYELVEAHDALEPLRGPPSLSIVPFRHVRTSRT